MKLIPNLSPIDAKAIQELGFPGLLLMEEAGRQVAQQVLKVIYCKGLQKAKILVICGKGNNGGDGFVCARHLAMVGLENIQVVLTDEPSRLSPDARTNFNLLRYFPIEVHPNEGATPIKAMCQEADIIVDAVFGSGLSKPIEGHYRCVLEAINDANRYVIAVDLPSGIDGCMGQVMGVAVKADETVTFATGKPGLYLYPGKSYAGQVHVVDIGIPKALIEEDSSQFFLLTPRHIKALLPERPDQSYKQVYGTVLVIAGSRDMPGAAVMAAEAALKAGAGLVILAAPESIFAQIKLRPEIMRHPLPESSSGTMAAQAFEALKPLWPRITTVCCGPGLSQEPNVLEFMAILIPFLQNNFPGPVVLDADALNALSHMKPTPKLSQRFILTPHLGEGARLLDMDTKQIQSDLIRACQQTVEKFQATVVLKSATTLISDPSLQMWINSTGNPGMATAGSGDILTGMITGFVAQGLTPTHAAQLGVYLHGSAGDKAVQDLTQYCLNATDLLDYLSKALLHLQSQG